MAVFLILFSLAGNGSVWMTSETGIYRPIIQDEVVVSNKGTLFIVQRRNAQVLVYDAKGSFLKTIGNRGQGPGEFALPTWIHYLDGHIYVEDANQNRVSCFTEDGKFVSAQVLPQNNLQIRKVTGGWLVGDWESSDDASKPVSITLFDEDFKNPFIIASWPRPEENSSNSVQSDGTQIPKVPINPAVDEPRIVASKDGNFGFLVRQKTANVEVIDIAKRKFLTTLNNSATPIPFNDEWGEKMVKNLSDAITGGEIGFPIKFIPDLPKYFPLVRELRINPNGDLNVVFWTGIPEKHHEVRVYDSKLTPKEPSFAPEVLERWFGEHQGIAYLSVFDAEEEEASIAGVPLKNVADFIRKNPIHFDGLPGNAVINLD